MSENTPAQAEATGAESVEFDHFGRTWHAPAKVRLSHQRKLRRDPSNVGLVDAFLPADEVEALDEIDPTDDELDAFTDALLEAMGLKGNS
jgi:hypothetical protein